MDLEFNTEDEVAAFQDNLRLYAKELTNTDFNYIDLVSAFNKLDKNQSQQSRLFMALIDLKMNFILLLIDNLYSSPKPELLSEGKDFYNYSFFKNRMEIHRHNSNYIPRYRAFWDKLMGIFILMNSEKDYETYNSSKSRKKSFKNLSTGISFLDKQFTQQILEHIQKFDDYFRTGELHRFGSLRKYSFKKNPFETKEYVFLRSSWNYVIYLVNYIDKIIENIETKTDETTK